jgi:transposase
MVRDEVRAPRPAGGGKAYAVRFETLPGEQAQVDFAQFRVSFTAEPGVVHIVWLFSMVLGYSRLIWGRFAHRQTMQTVPACHKAAFEAFGGVPRQILYDRMKTAVIGEDADGQRRSKILQMSGLRAFIWPILYRPQDRMLPRSLVCTLPTESAPLEARADPDGDGLAV